MFFKAHLADECPKLPLPCPNKCDKKLEIPRDEVLVLPIYFYLFYQSHYATLHVTYSALVYGLCPTDACYNMLFFPQLDQHIEEVCPKTKMICDFECIGCTHRVSASFLTINQFAIFFKRPNDRRLRRRALEWRENSETVSHQTNLAAIECNFALST